MRYVAPRPAEAFILYEVKEELCRNEITLKQDASIYSVGALVISEFAASAKTGKYVTATQALVDAEPDADFALVLAETDATAADAEAPAFVRLGVVKVRELTLDPSITPAEAAALLLRQTIVAQ